MAKEGIHPTTFLYAGKWREAPADDVPVSLTAHLSGCMLMEAMCVFETLEEQVSKNVKKPTKSLLIS